MLAHLIHTEKAAVEKTGVASTVATQQKSSFLFFSVKTGPIFDTIEALESALFVL